MDVRRVLRRFVPSRRKAGALLAAFVAYAVLMTFGGCADRIILFPSTQPIAVRGVERVEVRRPGAPVIEAWAARSRGVADHGGEPAAYCLEFVGNASRGEPMAAYTAQEWGGRPVEVWGVNYPGYGGSPGPARLAKIPPAAMAAYDALAERAAGKPIFVVGQSLGSAAALHVAANRPCAGVILTNPPPLRNMILTRFGWWNLWLLAGPIALAVPGELDSIANAKRTTAPAIFIMAGRDSVVPPKYQAKVFDAYAGEKRAVRVPHADHNDPLDGAEAEAFDAALDWVWQLSVQASPTTAPANQPPAPDDGR